MEIKSSEVAVSETEVRLGEWVGVNWIDKQGATVKGVGVVMGRGCR